MDYDDRGLAAMPKLVGGPKYSRPPVTGVVAADRPPDLDDLPLVSHRTAEDHALAQELGFDATPVMVGAAAYGYAGDRVGGPSQYAAGQSERSGSARRGFGSLFKSRTGRPGAS